MQNTRTIEIDFDVHKRLETERVSFSETANDTLRRILGIENRSTKVIDMPAPAGRPWSGKGVELPHGTELKMDYNGHQYTGRISNGIWIVEDKEFTSPSSAASGVGLTKEGKLTNLDGWKSWYVKLPGQQRWSSIRKLRGRL